MARAEPTTLSERPGRILALDLGDVRVGLALSDPLGITAQPLGKFERRGPKVDLRRVRELIGEHEVERVVVGHPLLLSGEAGERALDAQDFAARLERSLAGVPVVLWDERLSTVEAERAMIRGDVRRKKRKQVIDTLAATLILQSYLDAQAAGAGGTPR